MRRVWLQRYRQDTYRQGVDPRWAIQVDLDRDDQPTITGILDQLRAMELGLTD